MEPAIDRYIREHSTPAPEALEWLEKQTHIRTNYPRMLSGAVQGRLLKILVELSSARRVLEIGAFTGYSSAFMALGLPEGGVVETLEINDELEPLMRQAWEKAGVQDRIRLRLGPALDTLDVLAAEGAVFDMAFIDANKREYPQYFEKVLPLLRPGGLVVADDTLWDGKVYAPESGNDSQTAALLRFNDAVASDSRVETVVLPLRDGLTLIRKK
ncbi:MAG: class I SAM-dependent methyltransferase [Bacteroidales bacterium]|nr:class I SAM-dependent methyltransferase [Bacteroidales bacterium]